MIAPETAPKITQKAIAVLALFVRDQRTSTRSDPRRVEAACTLSVPNLSAIVADARRPMVLQPLMIQRNQYVSSVSNLPCLNSPWGVTFLARFLLAAH